jgi:mono/diheme cytochrome c family protein
MSARLAVLALLLAPAAGLAGPKDFTPATASPQYVQECAACHMAFPPALLPAASWDRVMGNLAKHYGTDASLDPATQRELARWLGANAGTYRKAGVAPPEDRITRADWFLREHRKVAAQDWKHPAIGSASNCAACHTAAPQGRFDERDIRIPR